MRRTLQILNDVVGLATAVPGGMQLALGMAGFVYAQHRLARGGVTARLGVAARDDYCFWTSTVPVAVPPPLK